MVVVENTASATSEVRWIGSNDPKVFVSHLEHKNVYFYNKCIFGPLTLRIGDYVLVSNADAAEPDTVDGCDIAKILNLYELRDMSDRDPYRAVVQWYSRPECIPHKEFDTDDICIDFNCEVIEEHRPYDSDISIETIFKKCSVICGSSEDSAESVLKRFQVKRTNSCPMFVCRYKFIKCKKNYRLVPLEFANDEDNIKLRKRSLADSSTNNKITANERVRSACKPRRASFVEEKRSRASPSPTNDVEFIDVDYFTNENKVSPIKIVGGRNVIRMSAKKQLGTGDKRKIGGNYVNTSPLSEKNSKTITPTSRASAARRNLNLGLDNADNTTSDSDCLNYSIVKSTPDSNESSNDMKIKLRVSERRRSTRLASLEEDPLNINLTGEYIAAQYQHKLINSVGQSTPSSRDIYRTPSKKSKESVGDVEMTISTRRKSILKSATRRVDDGTPKRTIQLSNIVEKRIFKDDDIISTPKRSRSKKTYDIDPEFNDNYALKKSAQKTPSRSRSSSTKLNISPPSNSTSMTPSQKLKLIRSGAITPAIEQRKASASEGRKSDLQLARERLHVSVVPESLPCREKEFDNIFTFLEGKIQDQCGGCMYVSGVPGTGKTATVTGVIRMLQRRAAEDELPSFEFLEINGMRLTEPRQAYVQIYKQLTGKTVSWEHAHSLLEKRFSTPAPRRVTTVLLVDELDILCNRRQDVVYNLLDWPTKSAARLVVVTIANTMDLPERLLMGKVTSRLGLTRLTFQPYTHKQLQEIVTTRLSGSDAFKGDAVQLVARKVAAVSGDARRALDICRRATEIADAATVDKHGENSFQKLVNMMHVQQALGEMISSAKVQAIKNCSRLEQIFLQAVVAEVTRTGVEETSFLGVYSQIESIAPFMGVAVPTTGKSLQICSKLGSQRLLICEHSRNDIFQKILLNVSMDDIHYALRVNNNT